MATRALVLGIADFQKAADVFSLLSAANRLRILDALCDREMCVGGLAAELGMPQPTVSQHLSLMFRAGLVARRKDGQQVHYRVDPRTRGFVCGAVRALVE